MILINVLRTEVHIVKKKNELWNWCDDMCRYSKDLYNKVNYEMRQQYFYDRNVMSAYDANAKFKSTKEFKQAMAKTSQQTILQLGKNWKSFFKSTTSWIKDKSKFNGIPKPPKYLDKNGRFISNFDYVQCRVKNGKLHIPYYDLYLDFNNHKHEFRLLRIIPKGTCYNVEIVYIKEIEVENNNTDRCIAIDLGVNNLATLTNNIGLQPIVINGKIIKSINNYYNKKLAKYMSYVGNKTSNRIKSLSNKRNNIMKHHMHVISRYIVNYAKDNDVGNIIIGKNKNFKRGARLGDKNSQILNKIPFESLIDKIKYKAEESGIEVVLVDERYTSKSSFIDNDILPKKFGDYEFSGKRVKRGLYKSKDNTLINADVNGSYNILRKGNSKFKYDDRIKGISLYPIKVNIT